jgi:hypothetical protein
MLKLVLCYYEGFFFRNVHLPNVCPLVKINFCDMNMYDVPNSSCACLAGYTHLFVKHGVRLHCLLIRNYFILFATCICDNILLRLVCCDCSVPDYIIIFFPFFWRLGLRIF